MNSTAGYHEFWKAANEHYPGEMREGGLLDQRVFTLIRQVVSVEAPERERFEKLSVRSWTCNFPIYLFPFDRNERPAAAPALTYKGLLNLKKPFDLARGLADDRGSQLPGGHALHGCVRLQRDVCAERVAAEVMTRCRCTAETEPEQGCGLMTRREAPYGC